MMATIFNIAQFQCTVGSSFDHIENTFRARFNRSEQPECDMAVIRVFHTWRQKMKQDFAPRASAELFDKVLDTSLSAYFALLSESEQQNFKMVDLTKVREIFCGLIHDFLAFEK